jgi:hypothetical protein
MIRRMTTNIILVGSMLMCTGCSSLWNRANVGALSSDVASLFEQFKLDVSLKDCSMIGSTRSGYCRFQDSNGDTASLIQAFHLVPVALENATISFIDAEFEAGCGSYPWILDGSGGELFLISGRPQSLSLANGTRFEYLLLVFEESSGEACVQVSYAYG